MKLDIQSPETANIIQKLPYINSSEWVDLTNFVGSLTPEQQEEFRIIAEEAIALNTSESL